MFHLKGLRSFLPSLLLLASFSKASASHIVGTDLRYEWVSGNTYKIILSVYGDCGPSSAAAFSTLPTAAFQVCVYKGDTSVSTVTLNIESPASGTEVTPPLCPGDSSQCMNMSAATPGIKLFKYSANYTLPGPSSVWRFIFTGNGGSASAAGRASAITNIVSGTTMQLIDTLNNAVGHNTNPVLNIIPLPYYSLNMPHIYNPVAIDAEGDSLVYSLVSATNGTTSCTIGGAVTYSSGLSGSSPLQTLPGSFAFNNSNGQMSFYPNVVQRGVVVYNIREYRAGVLIGTIQRELTVLIRSDANHIPRGGFSTASTGTVIDSVDYSISAGSGAFSIQLPATDGDPADTITVAAFGLPSGATFTTANNHTPHPVSTFSWNTAGLTPGAYTFYVGYADNACPMSGTQTIAYNVMILPALTSIAAVPVSRLRLYPNPASNELFIEYATAQSDICVAFYDIYGHVVKTTKISGAGALDISALSAGTYFVKVSVDGATLRDKIVVVR